MTTPTQTRRSFLASISDWWAYMLPMAIFMLFTSAGSQWPNLYPLMYVLKTVIVAAALILLWPHYTKVRWDYWWLGILVGVIGIVQWVGMEKFLMSQPTLFWTRMSRDIAKDAFNPYEHFSSPAMMWSFIIVRWAGASLLVPVMEELFWRDFLWRNIASPNDFKLVQVGEYDPSAFWLVPIFFSMVHVQWLTAIVWGLMIALLLVRTRSIGACIIAHGVTNFLLGLYVLHTHEWFFW
jgi:CAAX prenyl protease-like protein